MGLRVPHPLRLGMAPGQWVERHGGEDQRRGMSEGLSTCLELWVHCLVLCERIA